MFAKLINGVLLYAPHKLTIDQSTVYNPTAQQYLSQGWKEVRVDAEPTYDADTQHLEPTYEEKTKYIYQHWQVVDNPTPEPTLEEQVEAQAEAIEELANLLAEVLNG